VLVDEAQWPLHRRTAGLRWLPFLEKDGQYWGPPGDDAAAIDELERLRDGGARFLIVGRPAFWWLDHYAGFSQHLRANYRCVSQTERLVAFELTP
jgi:hypothetical protein